MKRIPLIISLWFCCISLIDQTGNFIIVGDGINHEVISVSDKVEKSEFIIKNTFNKDLNLVWRKKSNTLLEDWDYSVCAYGQCAIGVPDKGNFRKIKPGEEGFFALHLFPKQTIGNGSLLIDVYALEYPNFCVTLEFNITVTE